MLAAAVIVGLVGLATVALAPPAGAAIYEPQRTMNFYNLGQDSGLALDSAGNVYVSDQTHETVQMLLPPGMEGPGQPPSTPLPFTGLNGPDGLAIDGAGDVFVADENNVRVVELTPDGVQSTVPLPVQIAPFDLAFDVAGNLYVAGVVDVGRGLVLKRTPGGAVSTVATLGTPGGLAVDRAGDVFVSDSDNNQVLEFAPGGLQRTFPISGLNRPHGLALDADGNMFVADSGNDRVVEFSSDGAQSSLGFAGLDQPVDLVTDSFDDVYVTDSLNHRVLELLAVHGLLATMTLDHTSAAPDVRIVATGVTPCPTGTQHIDISLRSSDGAEVAFGIGVPDTSGGWSGWFWTPGAAPPGNYTVTAECAQGYASLQTYSAPLTIVPPYPTVSTVSSSANPASYGQPVTFTVKVAATSGTDVPTGGAVVRIDGTVVGSTFVADGVGTFAAPTMSVGSHTITTTYVPEGGFAPSTGTLTQVVKRAATVLVAKPATKAAHTFSAKLTRADTGGAISGQTITFSTRSPLGATDRVCSAITDETGNATCTGTIARLDRVFDRTYTATYLTSAHYLAATATGRLG